MKKNYLALVLGAMLAGMAFTSCSKDGNEDINGSENIIGTWKVVGMQSSLHDYDYHSTEESTPRLDLQFIFNQDKTGMMIENWCTIEGSGADTTFFSYTVDDNMGVITTTTDNPKYTIQSISENKVVISEKTVLIRHDQDSPNYYTTETLLHCEKK
ncbi:MAG: hypothetical protein ACSW8I_06080 [bacterium]